MSNVITINGNVAGLAPVWFWRLKNDCRLIAGAANVEVFPEAKKITFLNPRFIGIRGLRNHLFSITLEPSKIHGRTNITLELAYNTGIWNWVVRDSMREVAEDFLKALTHDEDPHQKFVFISYRRVTADQELIRTIYERLNQHFGDGTIFLDEETISPGAYWETFIKDQIKSCFFMLVIIDEDWLNYRQEHRKRSIDLREDYVRLEIQLALNAHLIMIPTLIDQADMPTAEQLPPSIKRLAEHQAFRVHSDSSLHPDLDRLIQVIDDTMDTSVSETWKVTGIIPQSEIGDGSD